MKTSRIAVCAGLVALAVMVADVAEAGGRRGGGPGGAGEHRGPAEALGLTDDQQTQAQALHETFRAEAEALRESGDADREAFAALRESHRTRFEAILTDEQKTQLETLRAEREANRPEDGGRGHGRRGPHGGGDRGDRPNLGEALNLSAEQTTQLETLRGDLRTQLEALRESGEGSREQAQALFEAHREQMQALLTDEQRATFEELRANRPEGRHPRRFHRGDGGDAVDTETESEAAAKSTAAVKSRSWASVKSAR